MKRQVEEFGYHYQGGIKKSKNSNAKFTVDNKEGIENNNKMMGTQSLMRPSTMVPWKSSENSEETLKGEDGLPQKQYNKFIYQDMSSSSSSKYDQKTYCEICFSSQPHSSNSCSEIFKATFMDQSTFLSL